MKRKYKVIIFDLDGTLIDSLHIHFLAFKNLLLEHNIKVSDTHLKELIGMPTVTILKEIKKKYKFDYNIQELREERRYHYFKLLGNRNIVFPGVKSELKRLHVNYKIAVATGSSKVIFVHSTDKEFQELFDVVVTINDVRKGKPDPSQFILTAHKLHFKPIECVVVGDSIYDAIAAKSAGMDFIGVSAGYSSRKKLLEYGAIKVIKFVTELEKFLRT